MRIGLGYDVHAFARGRRLVLGESRSSTRAALKATPMPMCSCTPSWTRFLAPMREGDIGKLFPDTDAAYAGADSLALLGQVAELMRRNGFELEDADCVLVLEEPRIAPYREAMRENLARAMGVETGSVGLKATTTEGLGFEGRKEGVAAYAVALLTRP